MKQHRFIIPGIEFAARIAVRDRDVQHHLKEVLKIGIGESVMLCDGAGNEAVAVLERYDPDAAVFAAQKPTRAPHASDREVVLLAALLKRDNFELVAQKAVEIGVARIVPLLTRRTVKTSLNMPRIRVIIKEAAEQCGRADLPVIEEPVTLADALRLPAAQKLFYHMAGAHAPAGKSDGPIHVFVGPEGGWEPDEITAATAAGAHLVTLGPTTLRGETAAIIGTYLALHL